MTAARAGAFAASIAYNKIINKILKLNPPGAEKSFKTAKYD
jgi:hypothetical protein